MQLLSARFPQSTCLVSTITLSDRLVAVKNSIYACCPMLDPCRLDNGYTQLVIRSFAYTLSLAGVHEVKTAIATHLQLIQLLCEEMKFAGLPGNEASRMRNNFSSMVQAYESLTMLKHYRTPLGLRVFARGYIAVTPIMFGPYYAAIAGVDTVDSNDTIGVGLAFTCVLSALTTLSMQGLFNIRLQLEDPFASGTSFDAIDISIETQSLLDKLVEDSADVPSTQDIIDGNATRLAQAVRKCTAATFLPNDTAEITGAADQWTTV
eukprot:m.745377 g.745377  ORF g.745377 m.745377 type:complete len:264 (+) comp23127_c3_seq23:582-1373(+)